MAAEPIAPGTAAPGVQPTRLAGAQADPASQRPAEAGGGPEPSAVSAIARDNLSAVLVPGQELASKAERLDLERSLSQLDQLGQGGMWRAYRPSTGAMRMMSALFTGTA